MSQPRHEAREAFRYRGQPIFGPHFRADDLARLCEAGSQDVRQPKPQESAL